LPYKFPFVRFFVGLPSDFFIASVILIGGFLIDFFKNNYYESLNPDFSLQFFLQQVVNIILIRNYSNLD
jgi:hypothetical protein